MPDTATNGAAPIEGGFINPFDTTLVKETAPVDPKNNGQAVEPITPTKEPDEKAANPIVTPDPEEEVFDEVQYIKNTFGWENADAGKAELAELRKLKEQPITFANPESEKVFNYIKEGKKKEIREYLDREDRLSKAAELEAKSAITLHLQVTNPHYNAQDIEDVLEERYPTPLAPKLQEDETDASFEARTNEWKLAVDKINRRINRDSLAAKEELTKLHTELILPDINRVDPALAQTVAQKELAAQQARDRYLAHVESDYPTTAGFKATVKDKEVEIPVSYDLTDEEKTAYKEKLKSFDLHSYFGARWFEADGKPKVDKIVHDLYQLENEDKINQKFVNDAASKRMEQYLKDKKNIKLDGKGQEGTFVPSNKEATEKALGEWAFAQ